MEVLSRNDWDFDNVPDNELVACCFWEYARESETLLTATTFTSRRQGKSFILERTPAACAAINRILKLPSDQRASLYQLLAVFDGRAWAELTSTEKAQYAVMIPREVTPLRLAYLEELEALLDANQTIPAEAVKRLKKFGVPESKLSGEGIKRKPFNCVDALQLSGVLRLCQSGDWRKGCSVVAVTVDFAHYNDKELAAAFEILVAGLRPRGLAAPKRASLFPKAQGKKLKDWKAALYRLGVMRALHAHTFADHRFPEPFRKRGEKACYFARKAALKTFHSLFPFHPKEEKPIHWSTKGSRSRSSANAVIS